MWRISIRRLARDSLNSGSSMTLGSKGSKSSPAAHRQRMPWTASKEYVPGVVLRARDKVILDGRQMIEQEHIERAAQIDPLEALKSAVSLYEFNTSTGKNIFQLAAAADYQGRGLRFYRKEWQEGTYDKYITVTSVEFDRDGAHNGTVYGYVTFHGESTLRPVMIEYAEVPGWHVMEGGKAVPYDQIVPPPPSIGTDTPVDPKEYRLKAYPYYDAPNPPEFVEKLLKDRGVIPDVPVEEVPEAAEGTDSSEPAGEKASS